MSLRQMGGLFRSELAIVGFASLTDILGEDGGRLEKCGGIL